MSLVPVDDEIVEAELIGDLDQLADIANQEHGLALQAYGSTVEHAFRAGQALAEAKKRVIHGEWLPWLEVNFDGSARTAQGYMLVATNPQRVADLEEPSLRKALKAIGSDGSEPSNGSDQPAPREKKPAAVKAVALALHKLAQAAKAFDAIDHRRLTDYADEVPVWSGNLVESMKAIEAFNQKLREIST